MNKKALLKKYRGVITALLLFSAMLFFSALFLPENPVWITDNGNKEMIVRNFMERNTIFFEHAVPANFPCGGFHFQHLANGKISSFHSPYLPVLTAWVCKKISGFGFTLLPMLFLSGTAWLLCRFPVKKRYLFPAVAAMPLIFYAVQLWEMVPAAFFVTLAAWFYLKKRIELAGFAFACGLWMREELYLLGLGVLIVLIIEREWKNILRFGSGAIIPATLLWISNYILFNNIFGLHGATYWGNNRTDFSATAQIQEIIFNFYQHIVRFETLPGWSGIAAGTAVLCAAAAGVTTGYRKFIKFKTVCAVIFTAISLILSIALLKEKAFLLTSAKTFGLFLSVPVTGVILLNIRALLTDKVKAVRILTGTVLFYTLAIPFLLNSNDIGLTWGARHFIMILQLAGVLCVYAFTKNGLFRNGTKWIFITLCASGIILQLWALNALVKVSKDTENLEMELLEQKAPVVISDLFFIPEMTPELPFEKVFLEVTESRQLDSALEYLDKSDTQEVMLILSPNYRKLPNSELAKLLKRYKAVMKPEERTIGNSISVMYTVLRKK